MLLGLVGKPSCGKSTFFKALTLAEVAIASYPFTTIKPNRGAGHVRIKCVDMEFNAQCNPREGFCIEHNRFVPVELLDVAGLVPGAHEGKGLGNQFLDDLRQADALIHVVDASGSANEKGEIGKPGSHDPANDVRFLEEEIDLWYFGLLKKSWEKFAKIAVLEHKKVAEAIAKQFSGLGGTQATVEKLIEELRLDAENPIKWTEEQLKAFAIGLRRKTKPMLIAANKCDIPTAAENIKRLQNEFPDYKIIPCSADAELTLKMAAKAGLIKYVPGDKEFTIVDESQLLPRVDKGAAVPLLPQQKKALEFIKANVLDAYGSTGVQQALNAALFDLLGYIAIFPGGVNKLSDQFGRVLPDCFLMPPGTTVLDFAFKLHTDFGKNFIRAIDVKKKLPVGKEHKLQNRDVVEIVSGK
ncbi:redox-regulated ATPase YchF [Candidatus Woesearchaeota archaeon]|nr:redox-regulated ATPase YchF [Candidatus Woesearchaeota archaeon]